MPKGRSNTGPIPGPTLDSKPLRLKRCLAEREMDEPAQPLWMMFCFEMIEQWLHVLFRPPQVPSLKIMVVLLCFPRCLESQGLILYYAVLVFVVQVMPYTMTKNDSGRPNLKPHMLLKFLKFIMKGYII